MTTCVTVRPGFARSSQGTIKVELKLISKFQGIEFTSPFLRSGHLDEYSIEIGLEHLELGYISLELVELVFIFLDELILENAYLFSYLIIGYIQLRPNNEDKAFAGEEQEFTRVILEFLDVRAAQFLVHGHDSRDHAAEQV